MRPYEQTSEWQIAAVRDGVGRRQKRRAGEGMVTPTKPIAIDGEVLEPGRDRLSPDHEWVALRPDLFRACNPEDERTRLLLEEVQVSQQIVGMTRAKPKLRWHLGDGRSRRQNWRLG